MGVNGLLMGIELSTGKCADAYHFSIDCVYSTPAVYQDLVILGGQDGIVREISVKE
ncbi:hypothetical protein [Gracilibacillus alcaliphilus]|uniref:hypothetical protein n=1 Tax=Gracilibacillus alcaliphilus TaxID=1401441 RepID=UPI0019597A05|nr:hypothetical protein [Gracilibacillus alcaliphilus]MBM7675605.1 hypothetical protein [Gracilibacillus alcaliphilus]